MCFSNHFSSRNPKNATGRNQEPLHVHNKSNKNYMPAFICLLCILHVKYRGTWSRSWLRALRYNPEGRGFDS